jgi:hypothetical protein
MLVFLLALFAQHVSSLFQLLHLLFVLYQGWF